MSITALDERISRLEQVRDQVREDVSLARLIDNVLGNQIQQAERRQNRRNLILNIVFLIAGQLLSLLGTPKTLAMLLRR